MFGRICPRAVDCDWELRPLDESACSWEHYLRAFLLQQTKKVKVPEGIPGNVRTQKRKPSGIRELVQHNVCPEVHKVQLSRKLLPITKPRIRFCSSYKSSLDVFHNKFIMQLMSTSHFMYHDMKKKSFKLHQPLNNLLPAWSSYQISKNRRCQKSSDCKTFYNEEHPVSIMLQSAYCQYLYFFASFMNQLSYLLFFM